MADSEKMPLVSICIITYNSGKTILETLESAFSQSYPELELIVSDDCSTDETPAIVRGWLSSHGQRFTAARLLAHDRNGGVSINLNKAIEAASGEWIKSIAGDDLMLPDCIKDNLEYARRHPQANVIFSKTRVFYKGDEGNVLSDVSYPAAEHIPYFSLSPEEQYKALLSYNYMPSVSAFYKRAIVLDNPFPEEYPFCEDWPLWLRLARKGERFGYIDKETVLYRVHNSLVHANSQSFFNSKFHCSLRDFFLIERYRPLSVIDPELAERGRKEFLLGDVALYAFDNRQTFISRLVLFILKKFLKVKQAR